MYMSREGYIKRDKLRYSPFFPSTISMSNSPAIGLLGIYPYYKLAALFLSVMLFRWLKKGRDGNPNGLPLPPGPKGYPLIGNLFDVPLQKPWVVFDEWRKTYGKTFIINSLSPQITGHFRWHDLPQCPWPAFCNFKFLGSHHRPIREKVFKLLWQNAYDYGEWTVSITFLSVQRTYQKCRSMQNELGYKHGVYAIRPVVATTQENISRVFPPWRGN